MTKDSTKTVTNATRTRLKRAHDRFCKLLSLAEESVATGDLTAAIGLAQVAACFAYPGSIGLFGSRRLEALLLTVGKQLGYVSPDRPALYNPKARNVLHVLSYGLPIGGDSRFVWRWIQADRDQRHSVAITSQSDLYGKYEVPAILRRSAEDSGGFVRTLGSPGAGLVERARELRTICQGMDVVVLHHYPYDIIPTLALATGCEGVRTVLVNHSDHAFWIGAAVAHSVAHLRMQPMQFLSKRRGLNTGLSSIVPIPIRYSPSSIGSAQAKRELGYDPNVVLLLTIATPFKYQSPGRTNFLDVVAPVLEKHPQAILIAVGPTLKGGWRAATIRSGGRIVPIGIRWDTDLLYAAADVYLDSIPFSSITSLLEAGSRGIPLLGLRPPDPELMLLGPGAPGIDDAMELANDTKSYELLLSRLITDPEFRRLSGSRVQSQVLSRHTGPNWVQAVQNLYSSLDLNLNPNRNCVSEDNDRFEISDLNLALAQLYRPLRTSRLIETHTAGVAYRSRLVLTWRLWRAGFDFCFLNLLPAPAHYVLRRVRREAKKIVQSALQVPARLFPSSRSIAGPPHLLRTRLSASRDLGLPTKA